jgi:hypothetical protein
MELYREQLEQQVPATEDILVAIDRTVWGRADAKTSGGDNEAKAVVL